MHESYGTPDIARAYIHMYRAFRQLLDCRRLRYQGLDGFIHCMTRNEFTASFQDALDRRINIKAGLCPDGGPIKQARHWDTNYFWACKRDQDRLQHRIVTHSFETPVVRRRFAHREHV
jgi:hypothetical protein